MSSHDEEQGSVKVHYFSHFSASIEPRVYLALLDVELGPSLLGSQSCSETLKYVLFKLTASPSFPF